MADESKLNRYFRENMRATREQEGISQGELSKRLTDAGWTVFHQTTVARIESGNRPVKLDEAAAIAQALNSTLPILITSPKAVGILYAVTEDTALLLESHDEAVERLRYLAAVRQSLKLSMSQLERRQEAGDFKPGDSDAATFRLNMARRAIEAKTMVSAVHTALSDWQSAEFAESIDTPDLPPATSKESRGE